MASYHFSVQVVSRGSGRSAVACAAYRAGERMACERDGMCYDYTRKRGVLHSEISLPAAAPQRWLDRETLWNEVENTEKRADAQLCRETVFAVPHELTREQQVEFCRNVVHKLYVGRGMVCDWSVHDADADGHNIHCHVMSALRSCDETGFLPKAVNAYTVRNSNGEERKATTAEFRELKELGWEKVYKWRRGNDYRELTTQEAKKWDGCKRVGKNAVQETRYLNDWNDKGNVEMWRAEFCEIQNSALAAARSSARVDHRSYERRGVELVPQRHEGACVRAMERKARRAAEAEGRAYTPVTAIAAENMRIREFNDYIRRLGEEIRALTAKFADLVAAQVRLFATKAQELVTPQPTFYFATATAAEVEAHARCLARERGRDERERHRIARAREEEEKAARKRREAEEAATAKDKAAKKKEASRVSAVEPRRVRSATATTPRRKGRGR